MTQAEIAAYIQAELIAMFPDNGVNSRVRNVLGDTIFVLYTHFKDKSQCSMGILENDPAFMHFMIQHDRKGFYIEYPSTHCNKIFYQDALKFRKINGKTELEAAQKLVAWFKKNRELILNVPK